MSEQLPKEISAKTTYNAIKEDLKSYQVELQALYDAYLKSGEILEEEMEEVMPELFRDMKTTNAAVLKLEDQKIYDWFIENMSKEIDDKISKEDIESIVKGLEALVRVEAILMKGADELMSVILPGDLENRVLN